MKDYARNVITQAMSDKKTPTVGRIKQVYPAERLQKKNKNELSAEELQARALVREILDTGKIESTLYQDDDAQATVWHHAFAMIARKYVELRSALDAYIAKGGLGRSAFISPENKDVLRYGHTFMFHKMRTGEPDTPYSHFKGLLNLRSWALLDRSPLDVILDTEEESLLKRTTMRIVDFILHNVERHEEVLDGATDALPYELSKKIWMLSFIRLGTKLFRIRLFLERVTRLHEQMPRY